MTMRLLRSVAMEPEWPGEVNEAAAEMAVGSREPEGEGNCPATFFSIQTQ
jgi:hypothetical protein